MIRFATAITLVFRAQLFLWITNVQTHLFQNLSLCSTTLSISYRFRKMFDSIQQSKFNCLLILRDGFLHRSLAPVFTSAWTVQPSKTVYERSIFNYYLNVKKWIYFSNFVHCRRDIQECFAHTRVLDKPPSRWTFAQVVKKIWTQWSWMSSDLTLN